MVVSRSRRLVVAALHAPRRCRRIPQQQHAAAAIRAISRPLWVPSASNFAPDLRRWMCTSSSSPKDAPAAAATAESDEKSAEAIIKPKNKQDELFLQALCLYNEREGNFFVPTAFVVPHDDATWPEELWGVPLGVRLRSFARGLSNRYKRSMLKSAGFPYDDWKTYVWEEQLLPSLRVFREIHGHNFVRFPFVVPRNDARFPKCAWGYKLGSAAALVRQQRHSLAPEQIAQLNAIDFIWTESHFRLKVLFEPAMRQFIKIFGHGEVPTKFVVPANSLWPKEQHDTKLGYIYNSIKTGFFDEETLVDWAASGGDSSVVDKLGATQAWETIVLPAMRVFVEEHGHTDIPTDYIVPAKQPWPESAWGYALGYVVQCVLHEGVFAEQLAASKAQLRSLGFRWNVLFGRWSRQLLPSLRCYHALYGHSDVPSNFVVPEEASWPVEMHKYQLGRQLQVVRKLGRDSEEVADAVDELDALAFRFDVVESDFKLKILPALHAYSIKYGHCDVPRGFVVPHDDSWPRMTWALKLGAAASAIRARKQYRRQVDEHREELQALGFSWSIPQTTTAVDKEVVQPCLGIYKQLYGSDAIPAPDFVVPSNDHRWPVEASGFKLGRWLQLHSRRRRLANSERSNAGSSSGNTTASTATSRAKKQSATPVLAPHQEQYWNEVLMASLVAYAQRHGSCKHIDANYVVPSEAPFPKIAWGLNLGLRVRYIRHHDRYAAEVAKYRAQLEQLGVMEPLAV